eukprot:Hpha_TRINITY_DN8335_c1_g1::TRINITY_DN8335_c1_g1_i1::g.154438::m.154438
MAMWVTLAVACLARTLDNTTVWTQWADHGEREEVGWAEGLPEAEREERIVDASPGAGWNAEVGLWVICVRCANTSVDAISTQIAAAAASAFPPGSGLSFVLRGAQGVDQGPPPGLWTVQDAVAVVSEQFGSGGSPLVPDPEQTTAGLLPVVVAPLRGGLHGGFAHVADALEAQGPQVVVLSTQLVAEGESLGVVVPHLLGHCFGLYHPWEWHDGASCGEDFVGDTAAQRVRSRGCEEEGVDSCPSDPGLDPTDNPMATPQAHCATGVFTPGQRERMHRVAVAFYGLAGRCGGGEAYFEEDGLDYRGTVNVTVSGAGCVPWSSVPQIANNTLEWMRERGVNLSEPARCRLVRDESFVGCYIAKPGGQGVRYEQCGRGSGVGATVGEPCPAPAQECPSPVLLPSGYTQFLPLKVTATLPAGSPRACTVKLWAGAEESEGEVLLNDLSVVGSLSVRATSSAPGARQGSSEREYSVYAPRLPLPRMSPPPGRYLGYGVEVVVMMECTNESQGGLLVDVQEGEGCGGGFHAPSPQKGTKGGCSKAVVLNTSACVFAYAAGEGWSPSAQVVGEYVIVHPTLSPTPPPPP